MKLTLLFSFILFSLLSFFPHLVLAQSYQLKAAVFAGTGCPAGSAAVAVSPDGSAISFLFDKFTGVELIPGRVPIRRASCSIRISLDVSSGYMVDTTTLDYRGFLSLNSGTRFKLTTSGYFGGRPIPILIPSSVVDGPLENQFVMTQRVLQQVRPSCPKAHEIRLNILAEIAGRNLIGTQFNLDSADLGVDGSGLVMGVALRRCK